MKIVFKDFSSTICVEVWPWKIQVRWKKLNGNYFKCKQLLFTTFAGKKYFSLNLVLLIIKKKFYAKYKSFYKYRIFLNFETLKTFRFNLYDELILDCENYAAVLISC